MVKEYFGISLRGLNTFGIEAVADRLVEFADEQDLGSIFPIAGRWNVLGGGSNILFTGDYRGTLLRSAACDMEFLQSGRDELRVRAGAGAVWDDFVDYCVGHDLWGAENLSGIPGKIGSAPVQNIGAYGVEAKDIIESVEVYDTSAGSVALLSNEMCKFGYRDSIFKHNPHLIIMSVVFRLSRKPRPRLDYGDLRSVLGMSGGRPTLGNIRQAVLDIRNEKLPDPDAQGNAGSFFKNPVVGADVAAALREQYPSMPLYDAPGGLKKLAAGWLIDRAGWKGRSLGRVGVHPGQALVLVNLGGATGAGVMELARRIQSDVREKFGVSIDTEVNIW